jgi:hypothetical protein
VDIATILLIAVSLAIDAFTVSIAHGMTIRNRRVATGMVMAGSFETFQAFLSVLVWLAGLTFIAQSASHKRHSPNSNRHQNATRTPANITWHKKRSRLFEPR